MKIQQKDAIAKLYHFLNLFVPVQRRYSHPIINNKQMNKVPQLEQD